MVFVTIGNARQGFSRLLEAVDELALQGAFGDAPVLVQTGYTSLRGRSNCETRDFLPADEFDGALRSASLVVCHGGCTLLTAIRLGKRPVAVPRQARFGEHVNDHQVEFVRALANEGLVIPVYEIAQLPAAVVLATTEPVAPADRPPSPMLSHVRRALVEVSEGRGSRLGSRPPSQGSTA